jgi:uncharacterized protein YyaL (SSP411 family)
LLQHAHNPVDWYPWGKKHYKKAKDEKQVLISIDTPLATGVVMEHESFEDVEVAKYVNEHFVCIKVDREERPDVDQVYMTAAQLLPGKRRMALNALALPNGNPLQELTSPRKLDGNATLFCRYSKTRSKVSVRAGAKRRKE